MATSKLNAATLADLGLSFHPREADIHLNTLKND